MIKSVKTDGSYEDGSLVDVHVSIWYILNAVHDIKLHYDDYMESSDLTLELHRILLSKRLSIHYTCVFDTRWK